MKRDDVLKIVSAHKMEIRSRFNVASLSLFGSAARDESNAGSDIDFLVKFNETPGLLGFLELKAYLEEIFQCPVDLVTESALKEQLRNQIVKEAFHAI
jgi:predicted nucleotidyltransferase